MKIGLISDEILLKILNKSNLCQIQYITPINYKELIDKKKIDFLLIESCWNGIDNIWKYKLAIYFFCFWRSNKQILDVIFYAKEKGIKVVFWSKEDDYHFDRFINVAKYCDYIFTVDENSIAKYKNMVSSSVPVQSLMFGVQPAIHHYSYNENKIGFASFVGSYSKHIHKERRTWQNMIFSNCSDENVNIDIYDRNFNKNRYLNKYPSYKNLIINRPVAYEKTASIYQNYSINFNVNSISNSRTMFSRRLIEILASGGICISSPALSIKNNFKDFVYIVKNNDKETLIQYLEKFRKGISKKDLRITKEASDYILKYHNIDKRLEVIFNTISN